MRINTKKIMIFFLVIVTVISLCGCKKKLSGGVLNVHIDSEVASMDPQLATDGISFEIIAAVTEGLYTLDADGNAVMALVNAVDKSEDGLTYIFSLKDASWSNGQRVTADDFVFAWRRLVDPETASEYAFMASEAGIKNAEEIIAGQALAQDLGVTAINDSTLKVELEHPVTFLESMLALPSFYPVNEEFFNSCGGNFATSAKTINCNGPFKVDSYQPAAMSIVLEKNDTYYDSDSVSLAGIKFQVIKESQQAIFAYERGDLDVAILSGEQAQKYKSDDEFKNISTSYLYYITPNQSVQGLDNENMRKALAMSFDKSSIVDDILKDSSKVANFIVPYSLASDLDGKDFRSTSDTYLNTNKRQAQKYWEEAKIELGITNVTYTMIVEDTESMQNVAQFIQEQIQSTLSGVKIKLEILPRKSKMNKMYLGQYELCLTSLNADYPDPLTFLNTLTTDNPNNYGKWSNDEYDNLIEACKKGDLSADVDKRWDSLKLAEQIAMRQAVIFPVYQKGEAVMIKSNVSGIEFHSVGINAIYKNVIKN